jgi:hypothetical protein
LILRVSGLASFGACGITIVGVLLLIIMIVPPEGLEETLRLDDEAAELETTTLEEITELEAIELDTAELETTELEATDEELTTGANIVPTDVAIDILPISLVAIARTVYEPTGSGVVGVTE